MEKLKSHKRTLSKGETLQHNMFWPDEISALPGIMDYESFVSVKRNRKLIKDYSVKWLGFKAPMLYFSDRQREKGIKCLNLQTDTYKLYDQVLKKSKHSYKLILLRDTVAMEFFFHDANIAKDWINQLRGYCFMCDFTSIFSTGSSMLKGNLAMVCWAQNKETKESYVAKMFSFPQGTPRDDDYQSLIERQVVLNEVYALREIKHPNIIQMKEVHELNGIMVLVMEFISGPSLLKHILSKGHLPEVEVSFIMDKLLHTLQDLHDKQIIHRNLKPENILLDYTSTGTELKLTEFGFSCSVNPDIENSWHVSQNVCTKCGTPGYMAPEILASKTSTLAADIFSMGVVLYTCLTGEAMFKGKTVEEIIHKNFDVSFSKVSLKWNSLSKNARDLILKMTHKSPFQRPTIRECLAHPFFVQSPKYELNPSHLNVQSPLFSFESDRFRTGSKESIEDTISRKEMASNYDRSLSEVFQSLILPPSYSGLSKSGALEVPEFYLNPKDTLKTLKELGFSDGLPSDMDPEEAYKLMKGSLKFQPIKNSLANLDRDVNTPRFNLKSRVEVMAETFGNALEEEDVSAETDSNKPTDKNYQKCYTFPRISETPFRRQSLYISVSVGMKTDANGYAEAIGDTMREPNGDETERKLPNLPKNLRKMLGQKGTLLESLGSDVSTRDQF